MLAQAQRAEVGSHLVADERETFPVIERRSAEFPTHRCIEAELFGELTGQRLFGRLTVVDLSSRKLPHPAQIAAGRTTDEQRVPAPGDQGSRRDPHGSEEEHPMQEEVEHCNQEADVREIRGIADQKTVEPFHKR